MIGVVPVLVVMALSLATTVAHAAVTIKNVQTWNLGVLRCWVGDGGNNTIVDPDSGANKTNCVIGHRGSDVLKGQGGNDRIDGEGFDDVSRDHLYGGPGVDRFYVGPEGVIGQTDRVDRIWDMAAGETICTRFPFIPSTLRRVIAGTGPGDRWIVARGPVGGDVVIAWVKALGSSAITVLPACFLVPE